MTERVRAIIPAVCPAATEDKNEKLHLCNLAPAEHWQDANGDGRHECGCLAAADTWSA